jgi:hypothetical protein
MLRPCCAKERVDRERRLEGLGGGRLFMGPACHQADETTFGWPDLGPITDLDAANRALERIVEQGEGRPGLGDRPLRLLPHDAQRLPRDAQRGSGL